MIQIKIFVFNPFSENTFVIYDETKEAIIVDPGCYESHEQNELISFVNAENLHVVKLVNTHCHIDHCLGNQFIKDKYDVELEIHKIEVEVLEAVASYASAYGFEDYQPASPDIFIDENEKLTFGDSSFDLLFLPGHSPGHIALINHQQKICIGGDVLFQGSIGRTDLPGGDHETLIDSIKNKLFKLDDDFVVYPGHGPTTTLGIEKISNPFVGQTAIT